MALGKNAYPLQQRLENSGILPMIGGGATTAARGFDDLVFGGAFGATINQGRNLLDSAGNFAAVARGDMTPDEFLQRGQDMMQRPTQTSLPVMPGALGKAGLVASAAAKGAPRMLPALGARFAPLGAAVPVGGIAKALSPQPDALSGPAFAPASPAPMPQGALAAEAQQRTTLAAPATATRRRPDAAAGPAMPPIPQERQANLAQAMVSPETLQAVAEAGSVRGGKSEPIKRRGGFSPENMGMIAFGLTLMTGGDMTEALNNGLTVHGNLDAMRDEKEQKAASQELLKNVPKEYVPALNALIASKQFDKVADYSMSIQEEQAATEAANAQRAGLVTQAAGILGVSPDAISMMPPEKLAQMVVNRFDTQDAMQINAQKAQIEASKQAALDGDKSAGIEFLAAYGVDATNLPEKAINKQIEKLSVGQFSQSESNAAGHAYIMASIIPRLEYLEDNLWDPVMGFDLNQSARAEYQKLMKELALAINRKDSGAAIKKEEMDEVEDLYGFKRKLKGGRANATAQQQRRNKYEAIKGQAGLALPYMMVNNPIMYDDDVLAGGVSLGVDTGFTPTRYSTNPLGIELEGVE